MTIRIQRLLFPAVCLLAGALFRFLYLHAFAELPLCSHPCGPDVSEYINDMHAVLQGLRVPPEEQIHAPLYGYFLAALFKLCAGSLFAVRLTQSLLVLASGLFFFSVLKDHFRDDTSPKRFTPHAFLAVFCLWPPFLLLQCDFFSENLLLILTGLAFFLLHTALKSPVRAPRRTPLLAAAGLAAGLAVISHPIALFFLAGTVLFLLFRRKFTKFTVLHATVFALAACVAIVPVSAARSRAAGTFVLVQRNSAFNFFLGNHDRSNGTCLIPPGDEWERIHAEAGKAPEGADRYFLEKSARFLLGHPASYMLLLMKKAVLAFHWRELTTWSGIEPLGLLFLHRFGLAFFAWIGIPGLAALALNLKNKDFRDRFGLFLLLFASAFASQVLLLTSGRYRISLVVPLMAFAPYFVLSLPELLRNSRQTIFAASALAVSALLVFLPVHSTDTVRERDTALFLLAESHSRAGNPAEAERILTQTHVRDASMLNFLGTLQLEAGRIPEAKQTLQAAFLRFPELPVISLNLGKAREESGDIPGARESYRFALEHATNRTASAAAFNLGVLAQKAGNAPDAERYYRTALAKDPSNLSPYRNFAVLCLEKGDPATAKQLLTEARRLDPEDTQRTLDLVYVLYESGEREEGIRLLREVKAAHPDDPRVRELESLIAP